MRFSMPKNNTNLKKSLLLETRRDDSLEPIVKTRVLLNYNSAI